MPKDDDAESRVYLKNRDGTPAIAGRKRLGQGEVILFTTSVGDVTWSDWFIRPAFLPVVQITLNHLLEGRPEALNRVAGERLEWQVGKAEEERSQAGKETSIRTPIHFRIQQIMTEESIDEKLALKKVAKERGISKSEAYREWQRNK